MKSRMGLMVFGVLAFCAASVVLAQPGGQPGGRGGFGGGFGGGGFGISRLALLRIEAVQKELELLDDQIKAIEKLQEELGGGRGGFGGRPGGDGRRPGGEGGRPGGEGGEGRRPGGEGRRPGGDRPAPKPEANERSTNTRGFEIILVQAEGQPKEGQPKEGQPKEGDQPRRGFQAPTEEQMAQFRKEAAERAAKEKEKLAEILAPHQFKRLNEIYLQQRGVRALQDAEIIAELKITEKQQADLKTVNDENQQSMGEKMREIFQSGDREKIGEKMAELRKEGEAKVLAVLTSDQKSQFEKMKGEPFKMPENAFGFGGRGGPGGGGQGGQGGRGGRPGGEGGQGGDRPARPAAE